MEIEDKLLFLKYALPSLVGKSGSRGLCSGATVGFSESQINGFVKQVSEGEVPDLDIGKTFRVATAMCNFIAAKMGKKSVDSEVIRKYFLFEHNNVVDERSKLAKGLDNESCKTYAGKILSIKEKLAIVKTRIGEKEYSTSFLNDAKVGDRVAVHFSYIIERVSAETEEKMSKTWNAGRKLKQGV